MYPLPTLKGKWNVICVVSNITKSCYTNIIQYFYFINKTKSTKTFIMQSVDMVLINYSWLLWSILIWLVRFISKQVYLEKWKVEMQQKHVVDWLRYSNIVAVVNQKRVHNVLHQSLIRNVAIYMMFLVQYIILKYITIPNCSKL